MGITYRVPGLDEAEAFFRPIWRGFGDPEPDETEIADEMSLWEPERSIGALDGDEWVGGTGTYTMDLTLPGGATVGAGGVTMVGVAATHRRRGILTELMGRQLRHIAERDEPVAVLTASESAIYGRFGFGVATEGVRLEIEPRFATLRPEAQALVDEQRAAGRLRQISIAEARELLPPAYERLRGARAGSVRRWPAWWETHLFLDRPGDRDGAGSLGGVVHLDGSGEVVGWALHRIISSWPDRLASNVLRVEDWFAADDGVALSLWRCLLDHDLLQSVVVRHAPLDDPLRRALREPRRLLASTHSDWLFLRLLDVPGALGPRQWGGAGRLVLDVHDPTWAPTAGRWLIESDPEGTGTVSRTDAEADLALGAEELAMVALGAERPSALARVGRVRELRPRALAVADALTATDRLPYCVTMF